MAALMDVNHITVQLLVTAIMTSIPLLLVAAAFATIFFAWQIKSYQRLSHIDGPLVAQFTQFWLLRQAITRNMAQRLARVLAQYGMVLQALLRSSS